MDQIAFDMERLKSIIRDVPDFPKEGILFKDITTLLQDPAAFPSVIDEMARRFADKGITKVVGVESRGFIFGAPIAYLLNAGFIPVRKMDKLPSKRISVNYDLEYRTNTVEMHIDAITAGERVLLVDDLLATGGTIAAAAQLVEQLGGHIVGMTFLIELLFLNGRAKLGQYPIETLLSY